jgi:hypothetical protein
MEDQLMPRRLPALLAALVALPLIAGTAFAAAKLPDVIPLANGWLPEGIAAGPDLTVFAGSRATGDVTKVDLRTGARDDDFIVGDGTPAVGIEFEAIANRLWVAGGPTGELRVYDASSGAELETYPLAVSPTFVNDVVVTANAAYVTDSLNAVLYVIPLGIDGSLPDPADVTNLPLSGDWEQADGFNANGIEAAGEALIVANSVLGQLYSVDPETGVADALLTQGSVPNADGILRVGSTLYVVQNRLNQVAVFKLKGGTITRVDTFTDADFDVPTAVAFAGGSLWLVNARFSTAPTPDTTYSIVRVPAK